MLRCGKLGHPKAACTVKMVPADEETKSTKSSSTKSSSSSSKIDMGKVFSSINSTFKIMGKAMSQVSEELAAYGNEDSIGAQSHALVGVIKGWSSYTFANGSSKMKEFLLLDNQSSDHVFCKPEFVNNIRAAVKQLSLHSNGGTLTIKNIANFDGFEKLVWFSKQAMINILSLAKVKLEYPVSYDGDNFIVHRAKHGHTDMVFKPHPSGLHVFDEDDPRGLASYSFIATVEENMSMFTKRQVAGADLARNLQAGLAYPYVKDLKWIVQANLLKDSPVIAQDVDVALKIWGPNVALLKGKTVCRKPSLVLEDIVEVPKELRQLHKMVTLTIDIFFVNSAP
jgi:hypothetical protein